MTLYWLSFSKGETFAGVCVVEGSCFLDAVKESHRLGCNPGGQVAGYEVASHARHRFSADRVGRLLTLDECRSIEQEAIN
jgi:hypothetical protein